MSVVTSEHDFTSVQILQTPFLEAKPLLLSSGYRKDFSVLLLAHSVLSISSVFLVTVDFSLCVCDYQCLFLQWCT